MERGVNAGESARVRWLVRLTVFALALALLVMFVAQNFITVAVRVGVWDVRSRLAWALLSAGGLGYVLGLLTPFVRRFRAR